MYNSNMVGDLMLQSAAENRWQGRDSWQTSCTYEAVLSDSLGLLELEQEVKGT